MPVRARSLSMSLSVLLVSVPAVVAAPLVIAAPGGDATTKVRICHRTNSLTNPYVSLEVARSSVDGNGGNDKGQGDHYLNHVGPVWTPTTTKADTWGDVIPPLPGVHDGRNWSSAGQALWSAGCQPASELDTDGDRVPDFLDPDTDGDGVPDVADTDDDADGTPDGIDADEKPSVDTDGDTIPDPLDADDDGDGLIDESDCVAKAPEPTAAAVESDSEQVDADADASTTSGDSPTLRDEVCGTAPVTPVDDGGDIDGDGTPNATDRDDDGDGTPDVADGDRDGDTVPDAKDPDDDGDRIPDVTDPDASMLDGEDVPDTDGDSTPDSRDRDDDGDGVRDRQDRDADGNGQPETLDQILTGSPLPARIVAGTETVLWREPPLTVLGVPAEARVRCTEATRAKGAPMGDVGADEMAAATGGVRNRLCEVTRSGTRTTVKAISEVPTVVRVSFTSPARGEFRALDQTVTVRVTR